MSNTFTQIHIQSVFAVKYRKALIETEWKERLHRYITGILQKNGHKMLRINSMPDHVHLVYGFRPDQSLLPNVINYVMNQEEHHRKKSFLEEYKQLLDEFGIDYDERYIFKPLE